ncbi:MAG: GntR family transcriptional regulator [Nocardiaceae bacterium]|nr:GntR family transcriptional regulator [Nocardiaceae bacterium]
MQFSDQFSDSRGDVTSARRLRADQARQVADVLRHQILAGTYTETLPAEQELADEYAVSRNTVREALALLRTDGLIDRAPKVGTRPTTRKFDHSLEALLGLQETLKEHGTVRNEVRTATVISAPTAVARRLGLDPGARVVYIERLRFLADLPLSLDLTYLTPEIGAEVLRHDLETNDIFVLLEQISGQSLGRADLALEAVAADPHTATTLDSPVGAPLLMLERLSHLEDESPVDLEYIRMRGDRITMRGSLTRATPEWKVL